MRLFVAVCFVLLPSLALAEIPTTFGSMTFGQPPEDGMICIVGPCSTEQIRPDIKQNRAGIAIYKKPTDITTYGGWQISSPKYFFFEGRFIRVTFEIQCKPDQAMRGMDEVAEALDQEYGLELLEAGVMELSEERSIEGRIYKTGDDTVIKFYFASDSHNPSMPSLVMESHSMMEELRKVVNPNYKPEPIDNL